MSLTNLHGIALHRVLTARQITILSDAISPRQMGHIASMSGFPKQSVAALTSSFYFRLFLSQIVVLLIGLGANYLRIIEFLTEISASESATMGQRESKMGPDAASARGKDSWYCPVDIANDLQDVDLPSEVKAEVLDCSWENTRCAAPQYTNWGRYVAFMRTMVVCTVAKLRGKLVNVESSDNLLGYEINATLATLFGGTPIHADMAREFRTFLLITSDKSSDRRNGELFRRYVKSLAQSPKQW